MAKFDLKEYARLGAQARVAALHAELDEIYRTFPELRSRAGRRTSANAGSGQGTETKSRRRRKPMTAAQRREVSQRMKKYWAGRRKEKA